MRYFKRVWMCIFVVFFWSVAFNLEALDDPVAVELHYQSGVKLFKRGFYDRATAEFERTLASDPDHEEARAYLEKIKALDERTRSVNAEQSKDEEIRKLYRQGRDLYGQHDFEAAKGVFEQILTLKPVDDFASFYKERCEIFIARKLAKEKKTQEKERLKKQREQGRLDRKQEKEMKALQRQAMLTQRSKAPKAREERKAAAVARREEKIQIKEAKKEEKRIAREGVREERAQRQEGRKSRKKEALKNKEESREQKKERIEERKNTRELFLKGVEQYGRKDYTAAITTFQDVIDTEAPSEKTYSSAAGRLMDKAKTRLQQVETSAASETRSP